MGSSNYYEFIGVDVSATAEQIDAAISSKYNEWRRLVTHHDPMIVNKANQALQVLEQARGILLDPNKKAGYDASLGFGSAIGGLADPGAFVPGYGGAVAAPLTPPGVRSASSQPAAHAAAERIDAWICPRCHSANPIGTRFCQKCGQTLGTDCPKCGYLVESQAKFCPSCGVNIRQAVEFIEMEKQRKDHEVQLRNEREIGMRAIISASNSAATLASPWWWLLSGLYGIIWIIGYFQARKALQLPYIPGDEPYRQKAQKAKKTAKINLIILAVVYMGYGLCLLVYFLTAGFASLSSMN